jgi:hypothetical protein
VLNRKSSRFAILGGAFALLAVGATPASAAMSSCPVNTPSYFTGASVYLGQEGQTNIWSTPVTLYAYCGQIDADHVLSGVSVVGVLASSNGVIPQLEASVDGSIPTTVLPVAGLPGLPIPGATLNTPPGLMTDSQGKVTFLLRAQSPVHPFLAGPDGAPQLIGLQLAYGTGTGITPDGGTYPVYTGGLGSIFASTPELDSLVLFGTGAAGLAGYTLLRLRARRRD